MLTPDFLYAVLFLLWCAVLCWQAQALVDQLERRKLYKYVSEVTLDANAQARYNAAGGKPTADEIVGYQSTAETGVSVSVMCGGAAALGVDPTELGFLGINRVVVKQLKHGLLLIVAGPGAG
jgi:hypothetical protein